MSARTVKSDKGGGDRKLQKLFKKHILHNLMESVNIVAKDLNIVKVLHLTYYRVNETLTRRCFLGMKGRS